MPVMRIAMFVAVVGAGICDITSAEALPLASATAGRRGVRGAAVFVAFGRSGMCAITSAETLPV